MLNGILLFGIMGIGTISNLQTSTIQTRITERGYSIKSSRNVTRTNLISINPIPVLSRTRHNIEPKLEQRNTFRKYVDTQNDFIQNRECLKVGSVNCQSVRNKTDIILDYILEKNLAICSLTETWLKEEDILECKQITPKGYSLLCEHRPEGKRGGGIALIYETRLNCQKISNFPRFDSFEYLAVQCQTNNQHLL